MDQASHLLEDLANLATPTVPNVQDLLTDVLHALVVSLLMPTLLSVFQSHYAPMVKTSAVESASTFATKDSTIMKESASMVAASQAISLTHSEDVSDKLDQLLLRKRILLLATKTNSSPTVNVLAHAQVHTPYIHHTSTIQTPDNALRARTTVSVASTPTSVLSAPVDTKHLTESAALQVPAPTTNSNTTAFASTHARSEPHLQAHNV